MANKAQFVYGALSQHEHLDGSVKTPVNGVDFTIPNKVESKPVLPAGWFDLSVLIANVSWRKANFSTANILFLKSILADAQSFKGVVVPVFEDPVDGGGSLWLSGNAQYSNILSNPAYAPSIDPFASVVLVDNGDGTYTLTASY